MYIYIHYLCSS